MKIYPENALLLAPLSGFSDLPYRRAARTCGCRYAFTEMVDVASLTYARDRSRLMLQRGSEEDFLGVQLVGSKPEFIRQAVEVINESDFSVLDFNLGCPVPKVTSKGAGAELGRHLEEALSCFSIITERSRHPVSAKIRIIDAEDPTPTLALVRGLAELGASAITIHGRIKEAFYSGAVNYEIIRMVREDIPNVQVIANGGVTGMESYRTMRNQTGCSRVMLARGAMGNPWLFRELTEADAYVPPSIDEWLSIVRQHVEDMVALYGELRAMRMARKILHDYLRGRGFGGELKAMASSVSSLADLSAFLLRAERIFLSGAWKSLGSNPQAERRMRPPT